MMRLLAGAGASAPWSPADLSPLLWVDASDGATITSSGGAVSAVTDKSGTGNHLTSTAGKEPLTGAATIGGVNAFHFGLGATWIGTTAMSGMSGKATFTAIAVASMMPYNINSYARLLSTAASTGAHDYDTNAAAAMILRDETTSAISGYRNGPAASKAITPGTPFLVISVWDGTTHTIYVDGAASSPVSTSGANWSVSHLRIGAHTVDGYLGGYTDWWHGELGELIVTGTALSADERAAMRTYAQAKWGTP